MKKATKKAAKKKTEKAAKKSADSDKVKFNAMVTSETADVFNSASKKLGVPVGTLLDNIAKKLNKNGELKQSESSEKNDDSIINDSSGKQPTKAASKPSGYSPKQNVNPLRAMRKKKTSKK